MYFPNAGSPGYISFGGENMYVRLEFLFWRSFEDIIFVICALGGKMQIARFALSMIKSISWYIGGSDEISTCTQVEKFWKLTL